MFASIQITKTVVDLSIDPVAAFAVITSVASLVVSIIALNRDRAKVHVSVRRGWLIVNAHPASGYEPDTPYFVVSVSNKGTRPFSVASVGVQFLKENGGFVFSDSMIRGSAELTQGKSMDVMTKMSEFEKHEAKEGIAWIYVSDLTGKSYYKPLTPFYKRAPYWFVRKFKAIKEKRAKKASKA